MNINPILFAIIKTADTANTAPDDYINPKGGLKCCGKCHTPKESQNSTVLTESTATRPIANVPPRKKNGMRLKCENLTESIT